MPSLAEIAEKRKKKLEDAAKNAPGSAPDIVTDSAPESAPENAPGSAPKKPRSEAKKRAKAIPNNKGVSVYHPGPGIEPIVVGMPVDREINVSRSSEILTVEVLEPLFQDMRKRRDAIGNWMFRHQKFDRSSASLIISLYRKLQSGGYQ